ncbi:MAG: FUSC family protein, partial [Candidatus Dormibacteraeota bacterium]|nr:FUSC family protein [Candidatus Dormibacteraeota bacterium]
VLMLAFLLGLLLPAPGASVASRVFVWIAAGLLATMAALVVWPHFERPALLRGAAMACEALAELAEVVLEPVPADSELQRRAATVAVEGAYRSYAITPLRPAGPRRRDRALVELLTQLEAARAILASWSGRGLAPDLPVGERLSAAVVRRLEGAAAALGGGSGEIRLDLVDLEETAGAHREAVCSWARDALRAGKPPEQVLDGLESAHTLRLLTHLTLEITENAVVAAGGRSLRAEKPTWRRRLWAVLGAPLAAVRALRRRLDPSAGAVRDGLRVALGMAALVLAARLLPSGHSPWMVVAAVAVLRANALATERTMVQALAGTLIGIAAAAVGVLAVGQNTYPLWLVLPVTTFLAAYTPGVATYALGQAATVVNTVVLLELTRPPGWQPGMVRIPELAACAVAAVVAGLLIWPRGSRVHLNRRLAALYRSASHFLATCLDRLQSLTPPPDPAASRSLAAAARQRAAEAFEELLDERLPALPSAEASARLLASGSQVILAGDLISLEAESGYRALPPREAEVELRVQAQALLDGLASLG